MSIFGSSHGKLAWPLDPSLPAPTSLALVAVPLLRIAAQACLFGKLRLRTFFNLLVITVWIVHQVPPPLTTNRVRAAKGWCPASTLQRTDAGGRHSDVRLRLHCHLKSCALPSFTFSTLAHRRVRGALGRPWATQASTAGGYRWERRRPETRAYPTRKRVRTTLMRVHVCLLRCLRSVHPSLCTSPLSFRPVPLSSVNPSKGAKSQASGDTRRKHAAVQTKGR